MVAIQLSVKTGERFEIRGLAGDPDRHEVRIPIVETWIGGVRFIHDCQSDEEARRLVMHISVGII